MQKNIAIIWASIVLMTVASIGVLMMQTPPTWPANDLEFHHQLILNIIVALGHTTGAVLFLANLDVYKKKLRRAYIILALGAVLAGGATLQLSILTFLNLWETPYGASGAIMLPFLLSGITMYMAIRSFAKLVGVKDVMVKAWIVLPAALILAALSTLLPHAANPAMTEIGYDIVVGISVWSGSLMLFAAYLAYKLQQNTGDHYTHAMIWLKRNLVVSGLVLLYVGVVNLIYVDFNYYFVVFNNLTAVVSGFIWIRAGYAFALTKYYDTDVSMIRMMVTGGGVKTQGKVDTVIDMVTSTAGLVSNVSDIDPSLDKVRVITAKLKPGEEPSEKEEKELIGVYLELEKYLTTKEAIRTFHANELRSRLSPKLKQLIESRA